MNPPVPLESPPCPICQGVAFKTVLPTVRDFVWRKPGDFSLARCEGCGLVCTRPRPTAEGLGFYYEGTYSGREAEGLAKFQTDSAVMRWITGYRLKVLGKVRRLTSADRLLDVGCSYGVFLRAALKASGCQAMGVDLDAGSIERAVEPGQIRYLQGPIEAVPPQEGGFSVITFFESLEHHAEPVAALKCAYERLELGGHCLVEVPDFSGFWRRVFQSSWLPLLTPQHLFHFTPKTLKAAFQAAGFTTIVHRQSLFYPFEGVASLGIALARLLRMPPPGAKPSWRTPLDLLVGLSLVGLYFVAELPSQALLRVLGLTGHQVMIARK